MPKMITQRNATLTLDTAHGSYRYEVLEPVRMSPSTSGVGEHWTFPTVVPIPTPEYFDGEVKTITDEEKKQRKLTEHAEKIVQTFRDAERGLLEEADLKRKMEREREERNEKRRSAIKQAMNSAFDAGLCDSDLLSAIPEEFHDHFDALGDELAIDVNLDNLIQAV